MRKTITTVSIAALLAAGAAVPAIAQQVNPCAAKKPATKSANPCAAKNPCAPKK